jgi:hypothetical protein
VSQTEPGQITQPLLRWGRGDQGAADALYPTVYEELLRLATEALDLAPRTVDREWVRTRTFLHRELREAVEGERP